MNVDFDDIVSDKWKQVHLETEKDVAPTQGNICSESRAPVSGILFKRASHSAFQSFAGIISALPEQDRVVVPHAWGTTEVQGIIVPFDGERLSSLGFQVANLGEFRIKPFARILPQCAQDAAGAIKPDLLDCALNKVVSSDEFCICGICYRQRKDVAPPTKGYEFIKWTENQVKPHSSKGIFTSFIVKIEDGTRVSFWGAPISTADGRVSAIVVHQRNLADGTIAIVGMQIRSFMGKIPLLSVLCQ